MEHIEPLKPIATIINSEPPKASEEEVLRDRLKYCEEIILKCKDVLPILHQITTYLMLCSGHFSPSATDSLFGKTDIRHATDPEDILKSIKKYFKEAK